MKLNKHLLAFFALSGLLSFTACSDDDSTAINDETPGSSKTEQYVIAASDSQNSYLFTTDDLSQGSVSPKNSLQVIGTPSWFFAGDDALYSFVYRKGDPGTTQSFALGNDGKIQARKEVNLTVSMQSKALIDDMIYLQYSSRNYAEPEATFYKINTENEAVTGPMVINTKELAPNGEVAYVTDIAGYKDYVLVGFRTIFAGENGAETFGSNYTDHTYLAVFDKNMGFVKLLQDSTRTGVIAGQKRSGGETGIEPVENGDIYVFSSALDAPEVPSGVLKINNGSLAFDQDYFFNISEASGGYKLYKTYYVGENTFVLQMFTEKGVASASPKDTRHKFAVVNVADKTFNWVSGVPDYIQSIGAPYVDKDNDKVVFPIESNGYPTLYIVDAKTATMTAGLQIKAEGVNAIGKLSVE